jgi:uncharacterized RDD family membrane protein YckC
MQQVTVLTSQNVPIQYEIANIGARIGAYLIDFLIVVAYLIGMFVILEAIDGFGTATVMLALLPTMLYHPACEIFLDGQSIGKRQLDLRVVRLDGAQPTVGNYMVRWIFRLIENPLFFGNVIGVISVLSTKRGQRLGDLAAGTTVVKLKSRVSLHDTIFSATDENYQPTYPQVTKLTDRDVEIIKSILEQTRRSRDTYMLGQLAGKVREVLDVDHVELLNSRSQYEFLQRVLKDYNHLTG